MVNFTDFCYSEVREYQKRDTLMSQSLIWGYPNIKKF